MPTNKEPITITQAQSDTLDKRVDQGFSYREARIQEGIFPLNRDVVVLEELPDQPKTTPPDLPKGTVLGTWKNTA